MAATIGIEVIDVSGAIPKIAGAGDKVVQALHDHASELGSVLYQLVQDKTPVLTGALKSDMTFIANRGGDELVWVFAAGGNQLYMWGREYVQYQEGPPLGVSTYTNPPRQMFLQTAEGDGFAATETWAWATTQAALLAL